MGRKQAQTLLAALISAPIAAQDYTPAPIPPQIIGSPQTMTPLNGGDDSTRLVQLAFPFEYYGQTFTQAWVSSNGFISFNNVGHLCCNGMPIEQAPRNTIYGLWSDLISGGNPYYRTDANSAVFGWYNTQEYGSGLSNTLEIALFPDGKVQWNYGDVNNQWHLATAGLTGPTMADSISLFYGQNVNLLDNTSYIAGAPETPPPPPPPEPEPEPPFTPVDAAPSVIESPIAQQEQVEEQEAEQAVQQVIEEQAEETPVEATTEEIAPEEEEVAQEAVVEAEEDTDERLDPNQLEELAASPAQIDEQAVSEAIEAVAAEVAAAEAAKVEAGNLSSNQTDADVIRADAPQLVQIEETKIEAASDQQEMREMSAQQDAAQADAMTTQSSQQDSGSSISIEEQAIIEMAEPQKTDVLTIETPAATQAQAQAIENAAFSTQQQEQTTIVVEQNSSSIDVQQAPQIQQTEQTKEPERLIDGIISSLEGYQDINTAFFHKEAIEDADTFQRERVIPVSVQDVGIVASANAELAQTIGEQTTTETPAGTYDILIVDGPTFAPTPTTGMGDMTSPVNQAQQMELLNMAGMQGEMSAGPVIDVGDVNSGENEAMTQLAAIPVGYSAYTQARIPDLPFYQPRDIYRGRRIPDANMVLYRMMQGSDGRWQQMVDEQYE